MMKKVRDAADFLRQLRNNDERFGVDVLSSITNYKYESNGARERKEDKRQSFILDFT